MTKPAVVPASRMGPATAHLPRLVSLSNAIGDGAGWRFEPSGLLNWTGTVQLFAKSSATDIDFTGKLLDVRPDGQSHNMLNAPQTCTQSQNPRSLPCSTSEPFLKMTR